MTLPPFPGYTDVALLGSGGFADVFAAQRAALGRRVAIKLFRVTLDEPGAADRFRAECAALIRLDGQDEVLRVHDADVLSDRRPFLVSELCSRSLPQLAAQRGGTLPVDEVVAVGRRIATALDAAHFARVLHGDVTPQNVLFRPGGDAVLADFGLAVLRDHRGNTATGFTAAHAAPEIVRADGAFTARTDVYGLASTLVTALTGQPPFPLRPGDDDAARALRILTEPAPRVTAAPPWLADLLAAMLAKDAGDRPTATEVVAALDAAGPAGTPAAGPRFAPPPGLPAVGNAPAPGGPATGTSSAAFTRERAAGPGYAAPAGGPAPEAPSEALERTRLRAGAPRPTGPPDSTRRRLPRGALIAAGAVVVLAAAGAGIAAALGAFTPPGPPPAAAVPAPGPATPGTAVVELAPPQDGGTSVTLSWTSDQDLDFGYVVAAEGRPAETGLAPGGSPVTLPVEPGLRYCFQVQGSDSTGRVSLSNVQSLRGAVCRF